MNRIKIHDEKKAQVTNDKTVNEISNLLWNFGSWLTGEDQYSDTIISSRIRLARNLLGHRYPSRASSADLKKVINKVQKACKRCTILRSSSYVDLEKVSEWDCKYLVERRLASPQLIENNVPSLLVIGENESISIMVNEEDHLRLQCIVPGLAIDEAWELIRRVDDELEENLNFSYSGKYGYLTACPTNIGTGMRVSVFVHLPAIAFIDDTETVIKSLAAEEIAVRGFYGEGTEAIGNIYQISNQLTLGRTENSVIKRIYTTAKKLIDLERQARKRVMKNNRIKLEDMIFRALGTLQNARLISSLEAMDHLSTVRLGWELGIVKDYNRSTINQLMMLVQPAHLLKIYNRPLSEEERDIFRAEFIRQNLQTP